MAIGGLFSAGLRVGVAAIDWATNGIRSLLNGGAAETLTGTGAATVDDILQGAVREGGSSSQIFGKSGGVQQAESDFNALPGHEQVAGPVKIKDLPGGGRAVLRTDPSTWSTDGRPSLDIQPSGGGYKQVAIRYN